MAEQMTKEQLQAEYAKKLKMIEDDSGLPFGERTFTVSVFDDNGEIIEEDYQPKEMNDLDEQEVVNSVGGLTEAYSFFEKYQSQLNDGKLSVWIEFLQIIDAPTAKLLHAVFDIPVEKTASIPNMDIVGQIINEKKELIGEKSTRLANQLNGLASLKAPQA